MIDTRLRSKVQPGFDLLGKGLSATGLTPNAVTVIAFIIGILAGVSTGFGFIIPAVVLLWLSGLLDVLDGTVARLTGKSSKLGAYLDLIFDRLVEGTMILGFYAWIPELVWPILIFYVGAMFNFTTFLVAATLFKNEGKKSMHYDIGILERTETFILFTLMLLLPSMAYWLLMVFNILMILTGILRFRRVVIWQKTI
jgi:phosphatidylglycerophosphate synthase